VPYILDRMPSITDTPPHILCKLRNDFVSYAERWIGTPYKWAGDDFEGLDCSGLVVECLKGIGWFEESEDHSANALYVMFRHKEVREPEKGCLVFWFKENNRAVHVAVCKDERLIIHAAGGGSLTETIDDAAEQNAYVKQRGLETVAQTRKQRFGQDYRIVDPFLKKM